MKNQTQVFLIALRALRNTLAAAVDQIDVILDLAERPLEATDPNAPCRHPATNRVPIPVMGHPNRFFCNRCKQEVEG